MALFGNPDLGSWLSNAGSDLGGGLSDVASGAGQLGSSLASGLGFGGQTQQFDPVADLQGFYNMGANPPSSLQDWYSQAGQQIPGLTGAVTPSFSQGLTALGNALAPAAPTSPMAMPTSAAGQTALAGAQAQAGQAASGATSAATTAQQGLGSGITATAPRFTSPTFTRPTGLQFGAGFGAPLP